MLKIDNSLLEEIGLGSLPEAEKNSFLKHVYETLEMRVGIRLADQMTNEQLDEFEQYFEAKDDAGAFKWLETNFPNYKDIVQQEFDKLKVEVAQTAPQILAASQAAQTQAQAPAPSPYSAPAPPVEPPVPTPAYIPGSPSQPTTPFPPAPAPAPNPPPNPVPQPQPYADPPAYPPVQPAPPVPPSPQPPFPPQQPPPGSPQPQ